MSELRWIGHSTALFELGGTRVLTDPILRGRVAHLHRVVAPADMPGDVDAVLISHAHHDHLDLPTLELLGTGMRIVAPRGTGALLRRRGFEQVDEVEPGGEVSVGALVIRATEAAHRGGRGPGTPDSPALGYEINDEGRRAYFAGDTDLFDGMADLAPGLDLALLPIAGWGDSVGAGHLDPERAPGVDVRVLEPGETTEW